jgi:hypothetical protein
MFELATPIDPRSPDRPAPRLPDSVRTFLIESERRVIVHCRSLLGRDGLSDADRRRLTRLASEAEAELQRLAA